MITDIRLSVTWSHHPKRKKLERELGPKAALSFIDLMIFVGQYKPEGVLLDMTRQDIAEAGQWYDDPNTFIDALLSIGLLDLLEDGTLKIHDWEEWNSWAFNSKKRSQASRQAAAARWERRNHEMVRRARGDAGSMRPACDPHTIRNAPRNATAMPPAYDPQCGGQCEPHAPRIQTALPGALPPAIQGASSASSTDPSPSQECPFPTPIPSPSPSPLPYPDEAPATPPEESVREIDILKVLRRETGCLSVIERDVADGLLTEGSSIADFEAAYQATVTRGRPKNNLQYLQNLVREAREKRLNPARTKKGSNHDLAGKDYGAPIIPQGSFAAEAIGGSGQPPTGPSSDDL